MYKLLYNPQKKVYCVRKKRLHSSDKRLHLVVQGCFKDLTQISENLNKGLPKIRLTQFHQCTKHKIQTDDVNNVSSSLEDNLKTDANLGTVIIPSAACGDLGCDLKNNCNFEVKTTQSKTDDDLSKNAILSHVVTNDTESINTEVAKESFEFTVMSNYEMKVDDNSEVSSSIEDNAKASMNSGTVVFLAECYDYAEDSTNDINLEANTEPTKESDDPLPNYPFPYNDIDCNRVIDDKVVHESSDHVNNFDTIMERELEINAGYNQLPSNELTSHENDLIDIAFLPTEVADIDKIYSAEQDLLNYKTSYMISDRLETILSAQFNSDDIESARHNDSDSHNFSLSPVTLRPREKYSIIDDSSPTSESHEMTVNPTSFLSNNDQSQSIDDINDENFDPSDLKNSSAVSIEIHEEPNLPNNDLIQLSFEIQEGDCTNETSNKLDGVPPNPNIEYDGCSSKLLFTQKGSCDNTSLKVQTFDNTPRWRKKYACPICNKSVCKLPRHMETVHSKEDAAKKLINANKGSAERKQILDIIRKGGSFKHNTDSNYNDGTLYVSRRPRFERPATDYTTCPNCLITLVKSNAKKHISKCTPYETGGSRAYLVLGRTVEGRLHKTASETLQLVVFPVLREDDIVRLIRYDWLIILYGNKLCLKYTPHYQHNMIRARLRLIGRFLYAVKEKNKDIRELADIYNPKCVATVVDAIKVVARINHLKNTCEAPAVALNLVTHIKQIAQLLETEYVIKEDKVGQEQVINFLKVYATEMPISINKIAMEADAKAKRQRVIILPMTDDINKLILYLKNERKQCFLNLSNKFEFAEWLKGIKLVAVYLLVFNRRRVGEIQNILLSDYEHLENIDMSADKEEFEALDAEGKEIAKKYKRIAIRGKRSRTVSVIMSFDVIKEIDMLLEYRQYARVPEDNKFLFGLPSSIDDRIKTVELCVEMPKIAILCGANKPELLRGTGLRKHIATKCIELELKDTEVAGVAGHLGHSEKIHHDHYRLPPKSRTIVQITKVLQAVQGEFDDDESDNENDDLDNQHEFEYHNRGDNEQPSITEEDVSFQSPKSSTPNTSLSIKMKSADKSLDDEITEKNKKLRWSKEEKEVVLRVFDRYLRKRTLPTLPEIDEVKKQYPCLQNRPRQSIKTWISNQYKAPPSQSKIKPRIVSCKRVNFSLKRKRCEEEDD